MYNSPPVASSSSPSPSYHRPLSLLSSSQLFTDYATLDQITPALATNATTSTTTTSGDGPAATTTPPIHRILDGTIPASRITRGKFLGRGAFGDVYQGKLGGGHSNKSNNDSGNDNGNASDSSSSVQVALKEIILSRAMQVVQLSYEQVLESLEREVLNLSRLSHACLVGYYGFTQPAAEQPQYIVLEFCSGGTLEHAVLNPESNCSWAQRWQWAVELCEGLVYLHRSGIIHRDIKTENILLDEFLHAKWADLGVAGADALIDEQVSAVDMLNRKDMFWAAPEEARGLRGTAASDVFSFGLVLWQIASGQAIWSRIRQDRAAVLSVLVNGKVEEELALAEDTEQARAWAKLVRHCWQLEPTQRPTAEALLEQLKSPTVLHAMFSSASQASQALLQHDLRIQLHEPSTQHRLYIPPFASLVDVEEDWDQFWLKHESSTAATTSSISEEKNKEKSQDDPPATRQEVSTTPQPLKALFNAFIQDQAQRVLLLLGDGGTGKSLALRQFAEERLRRLSRLQLSAENKAHAQVPGGDTTTGTFMATHWLPVLLRPLITRTHRWSHSALTDALSRYLSAYGSFEPNSTQPREFPLQLGTNLLLMLDGYDELTADATPQQLWQQLGLESWPLSWQHRVKLVVTCRRQTVPKTQLQSRFAVAKNDHSLCMAYLLPFRMGQMLDYLQEQLGWEQNMRVQFETQLRTARALRETLRNPFVLNLLVQSWPVVQPLLLGDASNVLRSKRVTRDVIYRSFIQHWLNTQLGLLDEDCRQWLQGAHPDLLISFLRSAEQVALVMFSQNTTSLSIPCPESKSEQQQAPEDNRENRTMSWWRGLEQSPWFNLPSKVEASARKRFASRKLKTTDNDDAEVEKPVKSVAEAISNSDAPAETRQELLIVYGIYQQIHAAESTSSRASDRVVLSEQSFVDLQLIKYQQFQRGSPLQPRSGGWSFVHKSFMEWLVASRVDIVAGAVAATTITSSTPEAPLDDNALLQLLIEVLDLEAYQTSAEVREFLIELLKGRMLRWKYSGAQRKVVLQARQAAAIEEQKSTATRPQKEIAFCSQPELLEPAHFRLLQVVLHSKDRPALSVAASNAMTLLNQAGFCFSGLDLSAIHIPRANLRLSLCAYTNFTGADLSGVIFGQSMLSHAKLDRANVAGLQFEERPHYDVGSYAYSICYSSDGKKLAVACGNGKMLVWDTETNECLRITAHNGSERAVKFSPDNRSLASGGTDGSVRLWNPVSGALIKALQGHTGIVNCVCFSSDGKWLASGSEDRSVRIWDVEQGTLVQTLPLHSAGVDSVCFSPVDANLLVSSTSAAHDNVILWDLKAGTISKTFAGHNDAVQQVWFSPDGQSIVTASLDNSAKIWDLTTNLPLKSLVHPQAVYGVRFSLDGRLLATAGADRIVRLWDATSGNLVKLLEGHTARVNDVCFFPDPQQPMLASGAQDFRVKLWDISSHPLGKSQESHTARVNCICYSPDSHILISASDDGNIMLWDLASGELIDSLEMQPQLARGEQKQSEEVKGLSISPDGQLLASGGSDKLVKLWDMKGGILLHALQGHTAAINWLNFDPTGKLLASASSDKTIKIWDPLHGTLFKTLEGHSDMVRAVAWSPDARLLASGSSDNHVFLWDVQEGSVSRRLEGHKYLVNTLCFSPNGQRLVSGSSDNEIKVWDPIAGTLMATLQGHTSGVNAVCFDPSDEQGRWLVSASGDKTIKVWDMTNMSMVKTLGGRSGDVISALCFLPNGKLFYGMRQGKIECTIPGHLPLTTDTQGSGSVSSSRLLWTSHQLGLDLQGAIAEDTVGLSPLNLQLITQRGAFLKPPTSASSLEKAHSTEHLRTVVVGKQSLMIDRKYKPVKALAMAAYSEADISILAVDTKTNAKVLIKKYGRPLRDLIEARALLREIKLLGHLRHSNIIDLREMTLGEAGELYLVYGYMATDLHRVIYGNTQLTADHIQYFMYQILSALKFMHLANVIHRDMKPAVLLVDAECNIKVSGLAEARAAGSREVEMTEYVVTRWYRAPEIALSNSAYDCKVDIWSTGCIFAELFSGQPLFPSNDEIEAIKLIFQLLGTPGPEELTSVREAALNYIRHLPKYPRQNLAQVFPKAAPLALDLMQKLLEFNPAKRYSAEQALAHPYFANLVEACDNHLGECKEPFNDDFEREVLSPARIKELIEEEAKKLRAHAAAIESQGQAPASASSLETAQATTSSPSADGAGSAAQASTPTQPAQHPESSQPQPSA